VNYQKLEIEYDRMAEWHLDCDLIGFDGISWECHAEIMGIHMIYDI
jgi:hypothetical protein